MKYYRRDSSSLPTKMVEIERPNIEEVPEFDSDIYVEIEEIGDQDAAMDAAEKFEMETGDMCLAKAGKVYRALTKKNYSIL